MSVPCAMKEGTTYTVVHASVDVIFVRVGLECSMGL